MSGRGMVRCRCFTQNSVGTAARRATGSTIVSRTIRERADPVTVRAATRRPLIYAARFRKLPEQHRYNETPELRVSADDPYDGANQPLKCSCRRGVVGT